MIAHPSYYSTPSTFFPTYKAKNQGSQRNVHDDVPQNHVKKQGPDISKGRQPKEVGRQLDAWNPKAKLTDQLISRSAKIPLGGDRRRVYFLTPQLVGVSEMDSIVKTEMERFGAVKRVKLFCNDLGIYKGFGFCDFEEDAYRFFTLQLKSLNMIQGPYEIVFKINKKKVRQASKFLEPAPQHPISHLKIFSMLEQGRSIKEKRKFGSSIGVSDSQVQDLNTYEAKNEMVPQQDYFPKRANIWSPDVLKQPRLPSLFLKNKEPAVLGSLMLESRIRIPNSPQGDHAMNKKIEKQNGGSGGSETLAKIHAQDLSRMANVVLVSGRTWCVGTANSEYYRQNGYRFQKEYLIRRLYKFIHQKFQNDS